ncbi:hypothetical protein [Bradyrhizobium canariense]|uniref:Uncharacterized protein n=1 Tax=Bradyrhizobium canariense TaxID=255045 RepID=A0A1H2BUM3_9BRAD|nr:hypothetical protein [Bradyrhizobium canariense]SDR79678.1 hypothetical protein SAMN05444158_0022 [Bradyrhizobium canariense]SDT61757.1 hypothetical protein SAMN05444158_7549 [Bradyrhizobium canariense]
MHGSFDPRDENQDRTERSWSVGFFALPVLLVIALVGLAITQPLASSWISEAVQAEFGPPRTAPTQLARPDTPIRTVKVH